MIRDVIIKDIPGVMGLISDQERNPDNHRLRSAFFFRGITLFLRPAIPSITLLRKPQSEKPRGFGGRAPSSIFSLQFLNMDGVAGRQAPSNS